jgi:hypothetical protein
LGSFAPAQLLGVRSLERADRKISQTVDTRSLDVFSTASQERSYYQDSKPPVFEIMGENRTFDIRYLSYDCLRQFSCGAQENGRRNAGRFKGEEEDRTNYCAALRGTDRGDRAEFAFDKASNIAWNGGRLI